MGVYDFKVMDGKDKEVKLEDYAGKVLLIINSATQCGFTPQYEKLQELYDKYGEKGFSILDFPCNQFGAQAPGTNEEIKSFCDAGYGVTFPMFSKIEVNGEGASPLFKYLKKEKGFKGLDPKHELTSKLDEIISQMDPDYKNNAEIKWNFTKFLIDRSGNVVERFEPTEDMAVVEEKIKELL